jgi:hypothetical protein
LKIYGDVAGHLQNVERMLQGERVRFRWNPSREKKFLETRVRMDTRGRNFQKRRKNGGDVNAPRRYANRRHPILESSDAEPA